MVYLALQKPTFQMSQYFLAQVFGFISKTWSMDDPQLSTIVSDVGKQKSKDKNLNKVLADSFYSVQTAWGDKSVLNPEYIWGDHLLILV